VSRAGGDNESPASAGLFFVQILCKRAGKSREFGRTTQLRNLLLVDCYNTEKELSGIREKIANPDCKSSYSGSIPLPASTCVESLRLANRDLAARSTRMKGMVDQY